MGEQMAKATRATAVLDDAGVHYSVHVYAYNPDADRIGMQAAQHLGMPPTTVLLEASALEHDAVFMNGGQRTLRVHLDPNDARAILKAHAATVVAES
jgi:prolyl-tRNA editing enzyme YbaK/EbsC (Cys-tRNA(Pro) deacylase)